MSVKAISVPLNWSLKVTGTRVTRNWPFGPSSMEEPSALALPGVRPVAGVRGLDLLTAGSRPPNPQELIGGTAFERTLGHLSTSASVLLIDTPAASECADYSLIAKCADVVLMVVRERVSRERQIRDFTTRLAEIGKAPLGIVYNRQS